VNAADETFMRIYFQTACTVISIRSKRWMRKDELKTQQAFRQPHGFPSSLIRMVLIILLP